MILVILKLPEALRATIVEAVLASVAVVAELLTLPAVEIVASIAFETLPVSPVVTTVPVTSGNVIVLSEATATGACNAIKFVPLAVASRKRTCC